MRIYTKTGDDGSTGLLGPGRIFKDHPRIEAYGCVDELNASIGLARATNPDSQLDESLSAIQDDLFVVGAALADPDADGPFHRAVKPARIERLEQQIDAMEAELPPLKQFILPGGSLLSAQLQVSRSVCRRAERLVVALAHTPSESVPDELLIYLNRLSDHLFVMARFANHLQGVADTPWTGL